MKDQVAGLTNVEALFSIAEQDATINGEAVDISGWANNIKVLLDSTAGDDADATLDLTIQHRVNSDDDWAAIPAAALYDPDTGDADTFTQVTNAAASTETLALKRELLKAEVRAVLTLGGATPVFTCGVYIIGQPKYSAGW